MDMLLRLSFYLIIVYLLLLLAMTIWQRRLLYLPDQQTPSSQQLQQLDMQFWPGETMYRGFVSEPAGTTPKGTVIVFHGNAGAAWQRFYYRPALQALGYRVLLAEYPGYGGRAGEITEAGLVSDARQTIEIAHKRFGDPVFLWGESLGAGVAAAAVVDSPVPIAGLILLTPWATLPDLAQSLYWYLPARWLVFDQYDSVSNLRNLQNFQGRIALLTAERDEIIPFRHSQKLYESLTTTKKLWIFPGATHNSWPIEPEAAWWGEVMDFVDVR